MPACSGRKCPSSFREGGRFYHPCAADIAAANPYPVHRFTDSGLAYPRRAYSCRACPAAATCHSYPHLAYFVAAACHSYPHLASPAAATCHSYPHLVYLAAACHSYPHLVYPAAADFGYRSAARHAPLPLGPNSRTIRAPSPILPKAPPRPASLLLFCPGPPSRRPRHKKRRTEPHRGPSAAKKQPICRGSITAAALQPVRSVHSPETDPLRIVRAGISG